MHPAIVNPHVPTAETSSEPSVSSAVERLVQASQRVITKRIDLALLEGQEAVTRVLLGALIAYGGVILASAAWLAFAASIVLIVAGSATLPARLAVFGLINAAAAVGLAALALRRARAQPLAQPNDAQQEVTSHHSHDYSVGAERKA